MWDIKNTSVGESVSQSPRHSQMEAWQSVGIPTVAVEGGGSRDLEVGRASELAPVSLVPRSAPQTYSLELGGLEMGFPCGYRRLL